MLFTHSTNGRKTRRPLIGCTTYRKMAANDPPFELFGIRPSYIEAITVAGGIPILIPLGLPEEDLFAIYDRVDGLLIPGGGDINPTQYQGDQENSTVAGIDDDRDRVEFMLVRTAVAQQKPMFAICRGHQVFNVAMGGTLWEDVYSQMPAAITHDHYRAHPMNYTAHSVEIETDSHLAHHLGRNYTMVNSLHHQGVRQLAPALRASAYSPDGLIEAIEVPDHPFAVGVQWHPENLFHDDPAWLGLFKGLVEASQSTI